MSSKTKIVVLRMKEVIYTGIFIGLALLLLILCFIMFRPAKKEASTSSGLYIPGLYSASLTLGNEQVNVEVTVDSDQILDVSLVHLNEAVSTMYPLMQPSMEELAPQILSTQSTENLTFPESSRYTCSALLKAVDTALLSYTLLCKCTKVHKGRRIFLCGSLLSHSSKPYFSGISVYSPANSSAGT